jgi:hypothetical protein
MGDDVTDPDPGAERGRPRKLDLDVELVPEQTTDDTDAGWGAAGGAGPESKRAELRRFLEDKPPHHGD